MNNLLKFLSVTILSLFVLGACTTPGASQTETQVDAQQPEKAQTEQQEEAVAQSRYASNLNCGMMKDQVNKANCEMQLNEVIGSMLESEIYSTFDSSRCKELGGQMAEYCVSRIAETGVKGPVGVDEMSLLNEAMMGTPSEENSADGSFRGMTFDKKSCEALKTEGMKEFCEKMMDERISQYKFEEIVTAGDVKRCDELEDENRIRDCKMFFGVEVPPPAFVAPLDVTVEPAEVVTEEIVADDAVEVVVDMTTETADETAVVTDETAVQ